MPAETFVLEQQALVGPRGALKTQMETLSVVYFFFSWIVGSQGGGWKAVLSVSVLLRRQMLPLSHPGGQGAPAGGGSTPEPTAWFLSAKHPQQPGPMAGRRACGTYVRVCPQWQYSLIWPSESMADCVEISLQQQKLQLAFNEASCFYF